MECSIPTYGESKTASIQPPCVTIRAIIWDQQSPAALNTNTDISVLDSTWAIENLPEQLLQLTEHGWNGEGLFTFGGNKYQLLDKLQLPIRCFEYSIYHRFHLLEFHQRMPVKCILGTNFMEKMGVISILIKDGLVVQQRTLSSNFKHVETFLTEHEVKNFSSTIINLSHWGIFDSNDF